MEISHGVRSLKDEAQTAKWYMEQFSKKCSKPKEKVGSLSPAFSKNIV
jgi:hypothetical protein